MIIKARECFKIGTDVSKDTRKGKPPCKSDLGSHRRLEREKKKKKNAPASKSDLYQGGEINLQQLWTAVSIPGPGQIN